MAHLNVLKHTLSNDLKGLIGHITSLEENSPEFKKYEDCAWSNILHRYSPSVSRQKVVHTIEEFVEKFKIHGFPQKAKNLKLLLEHYSKLEYFKEYAETEDLQWGILEMLIKLSNKPTSALEDDRPIELPLTGEVQKEPPFDWAKYLKEGSEKFKLPPSEDEESIWELSEEEEEVEVETDSETEVGEEEAERREREVRAVRARKVAEEEVKKKEEATARLVQEMMHNVACEEWLEKNVQVGWWDNTRLREIPSSKHSSSNWCLIWEEEMSKDPKSKTKVGDTRILSEYKVMRELLWVLGRPANCYTILNVGKKFTTSEGVSISSLSPVMFRDMLNGEICSYLPMVLELTEFSEGIMRSDKFETGVEAVCLTYQAYAEALAQILKTYRDFLAELEAQIVKQDSSHTMLSILTKMRPWLRNIEFLYRLHMKAVFPDWKIKENWLCAARLITVLFEEIPICVSDWTVKTALRLFLKSVQPYLGFIEIWLSEVTLYDPKNEFIITRPSKNPEVGYLEMRRYKQILGNSWVGETSFLDAIVGVALRAGASIDFLVQLEKESQIWMQKQTKVTVFGEFIKNLKTDLLAQASRRVPKTLDALVKKDEEKYEFFESESDTPESKKEVKYSCLLETESQLSVMHAKDFYVRTESLMNSAFEHYNKPRPSFWSKCPVDELLEAMEDYDLCSTCVDVYVLREAHDAIAMRMRPKGFAQEILLGEYKLLENLQALRGVYFLQAGRAMHLFTSELFREMRGNNLQAIDWTLKLRDVLSDDYPTFVPKFVVSIAHMPTGVFISDLLMIQNIDITFEAGSPLNLIITGDTIRKYNDLFQFFLQLKSTLYLLLRLRYKDFDKRESVLIRRLYSLRIWLLHTVNCLHTYFITVQTAEFEKKISSLCYSARDLHAILAEHEAALESWKAHCFLTDEHPCKETVQKIFELCERVRLLWVLGMKNLLADYQMTSIEAEYERAIKDLANAIHSMSTAKSSSEQFDILHDAILNNLPSRNG